MTDLHPQHVTVNKVVRPVGSELAHCLAGVGDCLQILFGDRANKKTLEDMYEFWPTQSQQGGPNAAQLPPPEQLAAHRVYVIGHLRSCKTDPGIALHLVREIYTDKCVLVAVQCTFSMREDLVIAFKLVGVLIHSKIERMYYGSSITPWFSKRMVLG